MPSFNTVSQNQTVDFDRIGTLSDDWAYFDNVHAQDPGFPTICFEDGRGCINPQKIREWEGAVVRMLRSKTKSRAHILCRIDDFLFQKAISYSDDLDGNEKVWGIFQRTVLNHTHGLHKNAVKRTRLYMLVKETPAPTPVLSRQCSKASAPLPTKQSVEPEVVESEELWRGKKRFLGKKTPPFSEKRRKFRIKALPRNIGSLSKTSKRPKEEAVKKTAVSVYSLLSESKKEAFYLYVLIATAACIPFDINPITSQDGYPAVIANVAFLVLAAEVNGIIHGAITVSPESLVALVGAFCANYVMQDVLYKGENPGIGTCPEV